MGKKSTGSKQFPGRANMVLLSDDPYYSHPSGLNGSLGCSGHTESSSSERNSDGTDPNETMYDGGIRGRY